MSAEDKRTLFEATLEAVIDQIRYRSYSAKYMGSGKTIYYVEFAFLCRDGTEMRVNYFI
ncbi:MAG: hypothetical protein FWH55_02015 [Oscillospiraceae bacterium]|nr:hypothetical protein [Oscillospiraceae bacterium]